MLTNSEKGYGLVHILIHWIMAALILWAAILGLTMTDMPDSFDKLATYSFHKSLGNLVPLKLMKKPAAFLPCCSTEKWASRAKACSFVRRE